ncbi:dioxygenase [Microbacterium sp. cf332]|uniref:dioxygenase n=1 Tax=Microbacterium sp. cf332 TaxID=1761804 RepID=UPI0008856E0F|nr:dioxygenase [Microbacterium sp. cf332]SDQ15036.1 peptidyl-prolyl cis-trans isomerase B (cyclophilin B) [Microbacterium sp. cf332]
MAGRGRNRDDRAAQERARVYAARREYHEGLGRRRTRDNIVAAIAGGLLIVAALSAQVLYFTAGPGAPAPDQTPTPTSTPSETPPASPDPTPSGSTPTSIPTP